MFIVYINISYIALILLSTNIVYVLHKIYHDNISNYTHLIILLLYIMLFYYYRVVQNYSASHPKLI